jgi:hypothetical protein
MADLLTARYVELFELLQEGLSVYSHPVIHFGERTPGQLPAGSRSLEAVRGPGSVAVPHEGRRVTRFWTYCLPSPIIALNVRTANAPPLPGECRKRRHRSC